MGPSPGKASGAGEEHAGNTPETIPGGTIYSYNLDDSMTPGGIKVRWKVRVVAGAEAARYDARQAEAIREILQWLTRN
jgi:hypothetical protein